MSMQKRFVIAQHMQEYQGGPGVEMYGVWDSEIGNFVVRNLKDKQRAAEIADNWNDLHKIGEGK